MEWLSADDRVEDGEVTILARRGHDWTDRFPTIRDAAMALPVRNAILDGEAVVEVNGIAGFSALQAALGARDGMADQPFPQKLPSAVRKGVVWVEPELLATEWRERMCLMMPSRSSRIRLR